MQVESRLNEPSKLLAAQIKEGFPASKMELHEKIREYWEVRHYLTVFCGVILYKVRIIIPANLRKRILDTLHSAHQEISGMLSSLQATVFWPGITNDIEKARVQCRPCHRNAPSQAKMPPQEPKVPTVPFEMIFGDYFKLCGKYFLIIGDRLSGWTEVVNVKPGTNSSGAKGLCEALRHVFVTFGVPEEISSDGGPEFTALESTDFYARWGTRHRLSSFYFPRSQMGGLK